MKCNYNYTQRVDKRQHQPSVPLLEIFTLTTPNQLNLRRVKNLIFRKISYQGLIINVVVVYNGSRMRF